MQARLNFSGNSSVGRASVFQTEGREFEPRFPLKSFIMGVLNPIKVGEHDMLWESCYSNMGYPDEGRSYTKFYHGTETKSYRKYVFFGPIVTKTVPKFAFEVNVVMADPNITRNECKQMIMYEYNRWIGLKERKESLARKEYI